MKEFNIDFKLVVLLAIFVRILSIYFHTPFANQDELSNIYDAISISETGMDRWGSNNYFILKAFGDCDYRPSYFVLLEALIHRVIGLNIDGARFISLFFGIFALIYSFKLVRLITNEKLALIYLTILAFTPIHIRLSSIAFESATMSSAIAICSLYYFIFYLKVDKRTYLFLSIIFNSLSIGIYQANKLTALLFLILIIIVLVKKKKWIELIQALILTFILSLPHLYLYIYFQKQFLGRAGSVLSIQGGYLAYTLEVINNYFKSFNFFIWFGSEDISLILVHNRFPIIGLPLFIIGTYCFLAKNELMTHYKKWGVILIYMLFALPEVLTLSSPHYLRNELIVFVIVFMISIGIYNIDNKFLQLKYILIVFIANVILTTIISFNHRSRCKDFNVPLASVYTILEKYRSNYKKIYIEDYGNQPYIYLLYYTDIKPVEFQNAKITNLATTGWDKVIQMDKFYFISNDSILKIKLKNDELIVATKKTNDFIIIDSVINKFSNFYFLKSKS